MRAKAKSKAKYKSRYESLNKAIDKLLVVAIKNLLRKRRPRRSRRKVIKSSPVAPPVMSTSSTSVAQTKADELTKEQQNPRKNQYLQIEEPQQPTNKALALISNTDAADLEFHDIDTGGVEVINKRTGAKINMSETEFKKIASSVTQVAQHRKEAEESKKQAEQARQEAERANIDKKTLEAYVDAHILEEAQAIISSLVARFLAQHARDTGKIPYVPTRKADVMIELNMLHGFREWFQGKKVNKNNKKEKEEFNNSASNELIKIIDAAPPSKNMELFENMNKEENKVGKGVTKYPGGALDNQQIDTMMASYPWYKGTRAVDTLDSLPEDGARIVNTSPMTDPKVGHWVAIKVSPTTLEYYDPLGRPPAPDMLAAIEKALPKGHTSLQFKINRMRDQAMTTMTCGWHAMKFLMDRYAKDKPFKEASGFNKLGEKQVAQFMKKYKDFGYI